MRVLASILMVFILCLAVKPGTDRLLLSAEVGSACCSASCAPVSDNASPEDMEGGCTEKACNPFQVCNCCSFVCLDIQFDYLPYQLTLAERGFNYHSVFISPFAPDCWHPPKMV